MKSLRKGSLEEAQTTPRLDSEVAAETGQAQETQMAKQIQYLRARLQETTEQYETTNEALHVANEALQAINEELRTTNQELNEKLEEISRAHDDVENLMAATDIPTLFLDQDLLIQRYTPTARRLFPLQPHDRNQHISHLGHHLQYTNLVEDARQVLSTLVPREREIQDEDGCWLLVRHRPYRALDDRIEGVCLSFPR